jgi:ABC-2 type transport system permease protein
MNQVMYAARAGVQRGLIELRQMFTNSQDLWNLIFPNIILFTVMLFMRGAKVPGTDFSLGSRTVPSVIGMGVVFTGMVTMMMALAIEREDGTLLRAKAVPHGMFGYLVGKVVTISLYGVAGVVLSLIPALLLFDGLATGGVSSWLTLVWVLALGLLACMPLGAVFGSLFSSPRNVGIIMLPVFGLVATSGIFYPINNFPEWLQWIAQGFPIYWMGLGMRSALLPSDLAAVEIGQSWRHLETVGVLSVWAILGLVLAPIVLRRMARRESGSNMAARREKALQRIN